MSDQSVYHVAYIATWSEELPKNDFKHEDNTVHEIKTDIRTTMMKKPFNALDVRNKAVEEMDVDSIDQFIILAMTKFDDEFDYGNFFCHPIKG